MTNTAPSTAGASTVPGPGDFAARTQRIAKVYGTGDARVVALDGVTVGVRPRPVHRDHGPVRVGQVDPDALPGRPGLGRPPGRCSIGDAELTALTDKELTRLRRDRVGFVFQAFNLVPTLTALENITLPMDIAGRKPDQDWLDTVIDTVGLRDRLRHRPSELSGGQQQRVACARALARRPGDHLRRRADRQPRLAGRRRGARVPAAAGATSSGQTIVMVTHDPTAAGYADRVLFLADGRIVDEMAEPTAERVLDRMKGFDPAPAAASGAGASGAAASAGAQGPEGAAR